MNINIEKLATLHPKLRLLVLFGSRARGDARESSDWDFGYIGERDFDEMALYTEIVLALGRDTVDLVDLSRANGLLRYRAAQDGKLIFEKKKGEYEAFWLQAVHFWCDAGLQIRQEYESLLENLG